MKFGLSDDQFNFLLEQVALPLQKKGATIWCFGSRARGDHRIFSDVDLMVESDLELIHEIGEIQEILSKSNFPFKVDIVEYRNFADSYKQNYLTERKPFVSEA